MSAGTEDLERNVEPRFHGCVSKRISRVIGLRCILVLLLSVGVFLSALFWLPPFLQFADQGDLDLDSRFKDHEIVASFIIEKPVALLDNNILQLENDIFDEIGFPTTKVVILSLEPSAGSNITRVVFAIDPDLQYSKISPMAQSLIRASFLSLVIHQSSLRLTKSLFGEPFFFEVLKFPGGITVIPPQSAFLLQKVQILFNFTLNFSIYQIQVNFNELKSQLASGLDLAPYENLYISLSNSRGSTVAPPTTVQSSVLLAVGNTPSMPRLKQLAQTITDSHSRNLGLNHTVFGRVKQVRLSSILQHSLHGGSGTSSSPSPAPLPHHHHHKHHGHHHHHSAHLAPENSPSPATDKGSHASRRSAAAPKHNSPAPEKSSPAPHKPPGCQFGKRRHNNTRKNPRLAPSIAPTISPQSSATSPPKQLHPPARHPPTRHPPTLHPPALPPAPVSHSVSGSSPLPNVVFAHVQPPSKSESDKQHSNKMPIISPSPASSSVGCPTAPWAILLLLAMVLHV